ncbi:hypothetical protein GXW74_10180 [Roseomonas eburnea]|uniref:Hydratase n=1 Tax=Neoroseomonas eburnea TaxID=1346889 RepID=A0A9X9XAW9_9PROT|nr:hypothetical protein [Neoroseomonas eburnea]MBR0680855.1 hypothetical protein [Neoroseomonas eburnea]
MNARLLRLAAAGAPFLVQAPALAACPDMATVARFGQALIERRVPAPFGVTTLAEALCARDRLVATLAQPWGDVEGFAIAGEATPPLRGALFHATLRERSGATMDARFGARPAVAPGLLLRLGRDGIEAAAPAAMLAHVEAAGPYLALLDLAAMPEGGGTMARIAGNLGLRLGVVGAAMPVTDAAALAADATLQADGSVVASLSALGLAAPALDLLAQLARELAAEGRPLRAGEHVALLAAPAPFAPRAGETWRLSVAGLGAVSVAFR